jgi:hypothetical protein
MDQDDTEVIPLPPWMVNPPPLDPYHVPCSGQVMTWDTDGGIPIVKHHKPQPNRPMGIVYWLLGSALIVLGAVLTLITRWL